MSWKSLALHWKIIIGMVLGIIWSYLSILFGWNDFTLKWIEPFGDIFLRLLKFIAVPLVLFSIITGVASLPDLSKLGRIGGKTLLAYLITTVTAVSIGLLLVNVIQPGSHVDQNQRIKNRLKYEMWTMQTPGVDIVDERSFMENPEYADLVDEDLLALVKAESENESVQEKIAAAESLQQESPLQFLVEMVPSNIFKALTDSSLMLQIIFFGIFFGLTLVLIPASKAEPVVRFIDGVNEVFLKMVEIVMDAAPYFVFALMAGVMAGMADTIQELTRLFVGLLSYSLTVLAGLLLMIFLVYPGLVVSLVKRISYTQFFKRISPAQFLAFSTSSSAATLPVTMECVRDNLGVSKDVTNFVLPIGATVNMDGTSLYQAVAVVFLAQLHSIDLTLSQQLVIVMTATLASIGSAAVPSAGLVMLVIVLQSVGLNPAWIAIIFPVDRILDMCRTVVNVTGDATVSTLIAHSEKELQYEKHLT